MGAHEVRKITYQGESSGAPALTATPFFRRISTSLGSSGAKLVNVVPSVSLPESFLPWISTSETCC